MTKFLTKLRGLRWVNRWNFTPRLREENVAEHSFWVAVYALALSTIMDRGDKYTGEAVIAGLLHDAEESITGDLPALVKRYTNWKPVVDIARSELFSGGEPMQQIRRFHEQSDHLDVVKAADLLAALMYSDEEMKLGNSYFERIRRELLGSLDRMVVEGSEELGKAIRTVLTGTGFDLRDGVGQIKEMSHL